MLTHAVSFWALAVALARAAPAPLPQVPGYTDADAPYASATPAALTDLATSFGTDSAVPAIVTDAPPASVVGNTRVSSDPTGVTYHGPFNGTATTTGAVSTTTLGQTIANIGPAPTATYYNTDGKLQNAEPIPFEPAGGLGTNGTEPRYMVNSDFDYESITLALYQEWIELDSFSNGIATFSAEDWIAAGLNPEDVSLIEFMAQQESGHATLLTNMLGETAPKQCTYNYPYTTVSRYHALIEAQPLILEQVREFIDFNQLLTRFGESGVYGFAHHLDSREVGQLLQQSIATEARQQMIFRQMLGLHPMPVWFETGLPQSWAWTYLSQYISSCPENNTVSL